MQQNVKGTKEDKYIFEADMRMHKLPHSKNVK